VPASVIALVSSLHLGFVALRSQRNGGGRARYVLVAASILIAGTPWLWPEWPAMLAGLVTHVAFFVATDRWAMAKAPQTTRAPSAQKARSAHPEQGRVAERPPSPQRRVEPSPAARSMSAWTPLAVLTVLEETADIRTFRLARPEGFDFKAGQFLTVRVRVDGKDQVRCYSISSAPEARGFLEISVKRQGLVSNALHATLRPGSSLSARPPAGAFVYPDDDDRPLVLLGGGVGITPLISMLRQAVALHPQRPVTLIQSARTVEDLAFADELRVIERRFPHVRWVPALTGPRTESSAYYPGRIDRQLLQATLPDLTQSVVCLCGPGSMIDELVAQLSGLGVPENQVRYERFAAAIASVGAVEHDRTAHRPESDTAAVGGALDICFSKSRQTFSAARGETILEAAEAAGVSIPSLCRAGVCGTCRSRVTEGEVDCESTALSSDDRAEGVVLACVAWARTSCMVEA
jgi:ferredoxin-NADP reductase